MRKLFAFLPEIPALAFGDTIDAVVPMAALRRFLVRSGKAIVCGARRAVRYRERDTRENTGEYC